MMMRKPQELAVVFRKIGSEVTALFPTEPYDHTGLITCYAHIGQHGGAHKDWLKKGRKVKPEDYAGLLAELKGIYGEGPEDERIALKVYK